MNTNAAVKAFAQLLKPNGTLACWFYGGPIYMSADAAEETVKEVQDLHHRITALSLAEHLPYKGTNFQYAATKIWKWLDNVPFDPSEWGNVRRVKWNTDQPLGFFKAEDLDFDLDAEFVNHVRPGEAVEERHDRDFWKKEDVNLVWVKAFIDANMPRTKDYKTEEVKGLFALMDSKMEGKKWDIAWPAVLLLATRK
ncbi:hypothetical protein BX600DRAFT_472001 [Xylariales sp. PMI_506]|nr:hypothetical protein BX600DRAFT_472001 [Xylariales sp. PMI_506]